MKKLLLSVVAIIMLCACSATRYVAADAPVVDGITLIKPFSYIQYVDTEGSVYDSLRSDVNQNLLNSAIRATSLPITDSVCVEGLPNQKSLDESLFALTLVNPRELQDLRIDPVMDSLLEARGTRYGLMVFSDGFVKDNKQYGREFTKALVGGLVGGLAGAAIGGAVSAASGGVWSAGYNSVVIIGAKYGTVVYAMVVDSQTDRVVYFNKVGPAEKNPENPATVTWVVERLFKKFPF